MRMMKMMMMVMMMRIYGDDGYACNKCQEPLEEACATRPNPPRNTKDTQTVIMMITTKS